MQYNISAIILLSMIFVMVDFVFVVVLCALPFRPVHKSQFDGTGIGSEQKLVK